MARVPGCRPASVVHGHDHPYEQVGYVVSGQMAFTIDGEERVRGPGDSYVAPAGGQPHSARCRGRCGDRGDLCAAARRLPDLRAALTPAEYRRYAMRIALLADLHGNLARWTPRWTTSPPPAAPIVILALGDLAMLGPQPAEVIDRLRSAGCARHPGQHRHLVRRDALAPGFVPRDEREAGIVSYGPLGAAAAGRGAGGLSAGPAVQLARGPGRRREPAGGARIAPAHRRADLPGGAARSCWTRCWPARRAPCWPLGTPTAPWSGGTRASPW